MNIKTMLLNSVYARVYHRIGCDQIESRLAISIGNVIKRLIRAFRQVLSSYHPLRKSRESALKKLELLSAAPRETLLSFTITPNLPRVSQLDHSTMHANACKACSPTDFPGLPVWPRLPWLPGAPC